MSLINPMRFLKSTFLTGLCLLALSGQARAASQVEDKVRIFSDITVVRPLLVARGEQPECREWQDNFQFLSTANKSDLLVRVRVRDVPKSKCVALANVAGQTSQFLLRSKEPKLEIPSDPESRAYWVGEWRITKRVSTARIEQQLNDDEIQIYRPLDTLTESWDPSCISVFDKVVIRDGAAQQSFYLLAISNDYPFLRRFSGGFRCPNWPGKTSASQYVATFDMDGGVFNEGAYFFVRSFGTFLLPKS